MKIVIFGNMGNGKTELLKALSHIYHFTGIAIDDFRRRYGDGTEEKELIARTRFFEAIKPNENQIIECMGIGTVAGEVFSLLHRTHEFVLVVLLIVTPHVSEERIQKRIWDVPYHRPPENIPILMNKMNASVESGIIHELWSMRSNTIFLTKKNDTFYDMELLIKEITILINQQKYLV